VIVEIFFKRSLPAERRRVRERGPERTPATTSNPLPERSYPVTLADYVTDPDAGVEAPALLAVIDGDHPAARRLRAARALEDIVSRGEEALPPHPVVTCLRDLRMVIRSLAAEYR
jgi:hypothetical protein